MSVRYFENQPIITIEDAALAELKKMASGAPLRRARFCLHHHDQDLLHEMVIVLCQDSYVRPHKHRNKSESFHMIEGELLVVFFDDQGKTTRILPMKPKGQKGCFLYRLSTQLWHTVIPVSEYVVFHEVTNGPFIKEECLFPAWAPDGSDKQKARQFVARIKNSNEHG